MSTLRGKQLQRSEDEAESRKQELRCRDRGFSIPGLGGTGRQSDRRVAVAIIISWARIRLTAGRRTPTPPSGQGWTVHTVNVTVFITFPSPQQNI